MLSHFLVSISRYLKRRMFFTGVNIVGLAIGFASSIIIYSFIRQELSYDRFHSDARNIYRVVRTSQINGMSYDIGITAARFAPALREDFGSEIEAITRALSIEALVTYNEKSFLEERLLIADSNFFSFFSYPLVKGHPHTVLQDVNSIVITRSLAEKYFGDEDAVGKVIRLDDQYDLMVSGIMADIPSNTHLRFDAVVSMNIVEEEPWFSDWWGNAFYTYVRVNEKFAANEIDARLPSFMEKYFGNDFQRVGNRIGLKLEPLVDIYFNNDTRYENNVKHGDKLYSYVFGCIGTLLLVLAAINYINLATAQASSRAKEVGIRKTLGSRRRIVAFQFLLESFLICACAAVVAVGIAQTSIPFFNAQFQTSIPGIFADGQLWLFLVSVLVVLTLAAGVYPAVLISSFEPVEVLKGQVRGDVRYLIVRKALVIFQFAISGFMIISTLAIGEQLRFMRKKDLGYQAEQLMVINLNNGLINRERHTFVQALLAHEGFEKASLTSGYPGGFFDATTVMIEGEPSNVRMRTLWTDFEFAETMGLQMAAGRFFSADVPSDTIDAAVLNATAVRQLGWTPDQAIGRRVMLAQFDSVYRQVIGVMEDYHFASLKQKIEPLVITHLTDRGNLLVRFSADDVPQIVSTLESTWRSFNTGFPLDFVFLDDVLGRLYTAEIVQGRIFTLFSGISLVIAALGVLGLGSYIASQRRKEIGIRKALGASTGEVSVLLMKDLVVLVLVSNLIAIPVGWLVIQQWLQAFAYRTELSSLPFLAGAAIVAIIACLIVGINANRVARDNPVHSLHSD